jgi:hypothetical protein
MQPSKYVKGAISLFTLRRGRIILIFLAKSYTRNKPMWYLVKKRNLAIGTKLITTTASNILPLQRTICKRT